MWSGYVYKIHCNITGEDYYGSTDRDIEERMEYHRMSPEHPAKPVSVSIIERNDWSYEIMEEVDYIIRVDLLMRERYYIENYPCININSPYRTMEEKRQYNIEYCREYRRQRKLNPEYRSTRERKYKSFECECGGRYINESNKAIHIKSKKHKRYIDNN
jgi:hypothetical protein